MANTDVDIIADLLKAVIAVRPEDSFCQSLWEQYCERGGLSKKQLEGLLGKATKFTEVSPGKLATLEAIIKKKHQKQRSEISAPIVEEARDEQPGIDMDLILAKYPEHKRILFLKSRWDKNEELTAAELEDIIRLKKAVLK